MQRQQAPDDDEEEEEEGVQHQTERRRKGTAGKSRMDLLTQSLGPSGAPTIVEEVARRLKLAEQRVLASERQAAVLDEEASKLRVALTEANLQLEQESTRRRDAQREAIESGEQLSKALEAKRKELSEVRASLEAAQRQREREALETEARQRQAGEEKARVDAEIRAERAAYQSLRQQLVNVQAELETERRAASKRISELAAKVEAESEGTEELQQRLRALRQDREAVDREMQQVTQQRAELQQLVYAARQAESEAKDLVMSLEARVKRAEAAREDSTAEYKLLQGRLASCLRQMEEHRAEREASERVASRAKQEHSDLVLQLQRATEDKEQALRAQEQTLRQLQETKEQVRAAPERGRQAELRLRGELQLEHQKLEHENHLLRLDCERAQRELGIALQARRQGEAERDRLMQQHQHLSSDFEAMGLAKNNPLMSNIQTVAALDAQVLQLRKTNQHLVIKVGKARQELAARQDELHRLQRAVRELELKLEISQTENKEITQRHSAALKHKDAEAAFMWSKLEHALKL